MSRDALGSGGVGHGFRAFSLAGWMFGLLLIGVGIANLLLVHPVPALGYGLVALLYLPPVGHALKRRFGVSIPVLVKVLLAVVVVMFTLGVSDLGDMIDGGMID